jgi:RNA polymerase sigma-70 factor (ECF subfamily)
MDPLDEAMDQRFDLDGSWSQPRPAADTRPYAREIREHLATCLHGLSDQQRQAFLLREVHGFATKEICKILEVTTTNLGVMLFRARNRLRECLAAAGVRT